MVNTRTVPIGGGLDMPLLGLGTWQTRGDIAVASVLNALQAGYRHIDTATGYDNETSVGAALRQSRIPRGEVFITTKFPDENVGSERRTLAASLRSLGLDYLDLWLIHWPPGEMARPDVWQHFIDARDEGLVRAIGVSNYSVAQIDELTAATGVTPAVNQIRYGPSFADDELVKAHRQRGVVVAGYSPFTENDLTRQGLNEVARRHGRSVHQVVLRWHLEHGVPTVPKSVHRRRMIENLAAYDFILAAADLALIEKSREGAG